MTKEKLADKFERLIDNESSFEDIFKWFVNLNKSYKKMKKEGKITDEVMYELADFFFWIGSEYGADVLDAIENMWGNNTPALITDIFEFFPKYNEIDLQRIHNKMDAFEIREAELLFDAAWNKNCRFSIMSIYYDWDEDEDFSAQMSVPRKDREEYKTEFREACAFTIYNRGIMIFKFLVGRGLFEIAGVKAINGTGEWSSMSEEELSHYLEDGFASTDKYTILDHGSNNEEIQPEDDEEPGKILYFSGKK